MKVGLAETAPPAGPMVIGTDFSPSTPMALPCTSTSCRCTGTAATPIGHTRLDEVVVAARVQQER
eukprot:7710832-Lingulodinium_polyedra.AAC.1